MNGIRSSFTMVFCLVACTIHAQNVGIGTNNPSQPLHVVGNTYISGFLGVNVLNPTLRLQVSGNASISGFTGLGVGSPSYPLHTSVAYVTTRLGVGVTPTNIIYAMEVEGSSRFDGNVRVTGWLAANEDLRTRVDRGIVRSSSTAQYKVVPLTVGGGLSANGVGPGASVTTANYVFAESFGSPPNVIVSHRIGGTGANLNDLWIYPIGVTSSQCQFIIRNLGNNTVSFDNLVFQCILLGVD